MRTFPAGRSLKHALMTAVVALAAGCAALPQPDILPPSLDAPADYGEPSGPGLLYRIDRAQLTLYTEKSGWLRGLAHGHVIETDAVHGAIRLTDPAPGSTARLYFRPWDLVLDRPESRRAAGVGFESERSAADIAATRARMLGPRGFDSNDHPFVTVDVGWVDEHSAHITIRFRGRVAEQRVPLEFRVLDGQIDARAEFDIGHEALGIRPYSAFAGAIAVAETIRISLVVSARRIPEV